MEVKKGKGVLVQTGEQTRIWLKAVEPENDIEVWSDILAEENGIRKDFLLNRVDK